MDLALRFDNTFLSHIKVARMELTQGNNNSSEAFQKSCQIFGGNSGNNSSAKYQDAKIKIYLNLSPACIKALQRGVEGLRIEVQVGQEGELKFFDIQRQSSLELNSNQIQALVRGLERPTEQELSSMRQNIGIFGLIRLTKLFSWGTKDLAEKLVGLEYLGYIIFLIGLLFSLKKGITLMHTSLNTFFVLRVIDTLHCINSHSGIGIFTYLNLSSSSTSIFAPNQVSSQGPSKKMTLDSPYYRPNSNQSILGTNGISVLATHAHKLEFLLLGLMLAIILARKKAEGYFQSLAEKFGANFFIIGKDPNESRY